MPALNASACDPARAPLAIDESTKCTPVARLKFKAQRLSLGKTKRYQVDVAEANAALAEPESTSL